MLDEKNIWLLQFIDNLVKEEKSIIYLDEKSRNQRQNDVILDFLLANDEINSDYFDNVPRLFNLLKEGYLTTLHLNDTIILQITSKAYYEIEKHRRMIGEENNKRKSESFTRVTTIIALVLTTLALILNVILN